MKIKFWHVVAIAALGGGAYYLSKKPTTTGTGLGTTKEGVYRGVEYRIEENVRDGTFTVVVFWVDQAGKKYATQLPYDYATIQEAEAAALAHIADMLPTAEIAGAALG